MTHPLQDRVTQLSRRVRRLRWTWAIARTLAWAISAVLLIGMADYLIRFGDVGVRVLASLTVCGTLVWACIRFLAPVWRRRSTQLAMAQQIQRRYPGLEDRLASSLEFLCVAPDNLTAGSSELRESVIRETTEQLDQVDFGELISTHAIRRASTMAIVLLAIGVGLFVWDASSTHLALARMAQPWADLRWPQQHHLALRDAPAQLATGADFDAEIFDLNDAELPDDVQVHFRVFEDAEPKTVAADPVAVIGGAMFARRENVTYSFEYRVSGGDDDSMPWTRLDVIDSPRLASIDVMLHPPQYTGWNPYPGEQRIRAYQGTRVAMTGRLTKPVRAVRLHRPDMPPLVAELNDAGDKFTFAPSGPSALVVEASSPYWLEMDDIENEDLVGGRDDRWNIVALTDQKPSVLFEQPSRDVAVLPSAVVPLRIVVKDDLRTHTVDLHYRPTQAAEGQTQHVRLMEAPRPTPANASSPSDMGDQHVVTYDWNLSELDLKPGTEILVHATVADFRPQHAESSVRRLRIVKPAELLEQVASRQAAILTDLARIRQLQIAAREQATATRIQLEEVRRVDRAISDRAHAAMLSQQQVDRAVDHPTDGVLARIDAVLADIRSNHLDRDQIAEQLAEIAAQVRRLNDEELPEARRQLGAARKSTQDAGGRVSTDKIVEHLAAADRAQQEVVAVLDKILGKHGQWSSFHQLYRDVARIKATQEKLLGRTGTLGEKTVGRRFTELEAQQQADLRKLAFSQTELSRQVENVRQQLRVAAEKAAQGGDADTGDVRNALADATRLANEANVAAKMQRVGKDLEANRIGSATTAQKSLVESLDQLLDVLANRRERRLGRLVEQLKAAERELQGLKQQQEQLRKRFSEARSESDDEKRQRELKRLMKQQQELKEKVDQFARQLRRLQADKAGHSAARASKRMASGAAAAEGGNAGGAESMAQAAADDLEQAAHELAQRRQAAEMDLAREQMVSLEKVLKQMVERQKAILDQTKAIEDSGATRTADGPWVRELVTLARRQELLREETNTAAKSLATLEIVRATLERAAEKMSAAAALLRQRQAGAEVQQAERDALRQLGYVTQALSPDSKKSGGPSASPGGGSGGGKSGGGNVFNVAELRLVAMIQEQLTLRTAALEADIETGMELNPAQKAEYNDIRKQQAQLADWIFRLTEPAAADPEDRPEDFLPAADPDRKRPQYPALIEDLLPSLFKDE